LFAHLTRPGTEVIAWFDRQHRVAHTPAREWNGNARWASWWGASLSGASRQVSRPGERALTPLKGRSHGTTVSSNRIDHSFDPLAARAGQQSFRGGTLLTVGRVAPLRARLRSRRWPVVGGERGVAILQPAFDGFLRHRVRTLKSWTFLRLALSQSACRSHSSRCLSGRPWPSVYLGSMLAAHQLDGVYDQDPPEMAVTFFRSSPRRCRARRFMGVGDSADAPQGSVALSMIRALRDNNRCASA
jgi:hypothetical protein